MKGFTLGLTLRQRRKATRKSPISRVQNVVFLVFPLVCSSGLILFMTIVCLINEFNIISFCTGQSAVFKCLSGDWEKITFWLPLVSNGTENKTFNDKRYLELTSNWKGLSYQHPTQRDWVYLSELEIRLSWHIITCLPTTANITATKRIIRGTMYQCKVDVDMLNALKCVLADISSLCSDKGLTLEMSANTLFTAFSISTSTFCWYVVRFTATPMQTKTSSHRD